MRFSLWQSASRNAGHRTDKAQPSIPFLSSQEEQSTLSSWGTPSCTQQSSSALLTANALRGFVWIINTPALKLSHSLPGNEDLAKLAAPPWTHQQEETLLKNNPSSLDKFFSFGKELWSKLSQFHIFTGFILFIDVLFLSSYLSIKVLLF